MSSARGKRRQGRPDKRVEFKAATWNLRYDVPAERQVATIDKLDDAGVGIVLLQEFSKPGVGLALRSRGYFVERGGGNRGVAWNHEWRRLHRKRRSSLRLTKLHHLFANGSPAWSDVAVVVLQHRGSGKTVKALSYHTPSGVQKAGRPGGGIRVRVLKASMRRLARIGKHSSKVDALLFGGDDNADESKARKAWRFMLRGATGLRLVQAPKPTHAGGRRIDDFRIRGLRLVGDGRVMDTPGDHNVHVRTFEFK